MRVSKLQQVAVAALEDIKARDIAVFDVRQQTSLYDTLVIASADSNRQVKALANHVRDRLKEAGATILGTEGYLELRKNVDIAGRPGADHLFVVDGAGTDHIDCSEVQLPYYPSLVRDVRERTETATPQQHTFEVMRLALQAQDRATKLGNAR